MCVAGVAHRSARRELFLLLPTVSYYICFVSVALYHYDRFFLGICLVLALFGGSWLATQLKATRGRRWRQAGVAGVLLASFFRGALVDVMLVNEARYVVERWLRQPENAVGEVGMAGFDIYLPRFDERRTREIREDWPEVLETSPRFIVINLGHSCRAQAGREEEFYARLRDPSNGYRRAMAHRSDPSWPPVGSAQFWRRECPDGLTNLAAINPEIQVFERVGP